MQDVGAALAVIDEVCQAASAGEQTVPAGFGICRPPGHHATPQVGKVASHRTPRCCASSCASRQRYWMSFTRGWDISVELPDVTALHALCSLHSMHQLVLAWKTGSHHRRCACVRVRWGSAYSTRLPSPQSMPSSGMVCSGSWCSTLTCITATVVMTCAAVVVCVGLHSGCCKYGNVNSRCCLSKREHQQHHAQHYVDEDQGNLPCRSL